MNFLSRTLVGSIAFVVFAVPATLLAANVSAGVPQESIWFSKDPFFAGEQITVFVPLYNSSPYRFGGTLMLRDDATTIGTQEFTLAPNGAAGVFAFPWKATTGNHAFSATITGGEFLSSGKAVAGLSISQGTAETVKRFVEVAPETPRDESKIPEDKKATANRSTADLKQRASVGAIDLSSPDATAKIVDNIKTGLPAEMTARVTPLVAPLEQFRSAQSRKADHMVNTLKETLAQRNSTPKSGGGWDVLRDGVIKGDVARAPWEYVKLFFALCYQFFTTNVYAFYILLSYVAFRIIRVVIGALT